jgi:hypothetical protein
VIEVKSAILEMFQDLHRGTLSLSRLNYGMITTWKPQIGHAILVTDPIGNGPLRSVTKKTKGNRHH